MGICASQGEGSAKHAEIEASLKEAREKLQNEIKVLLLGAGESGKSTIVKQMIILHSGGFDEQNRAFYKKHLIQNTLDSMQSILNALDTIEVGVADVSNQELKDLVQTGPFYLPGGVISPEVWSALAVLRNDLNVRKVLKRANEFQILDSAKYFLENLDRFGSSDFVPTDEDILRTRTKTTGIIENRFKMNRHTFLLIDVGGQRSERKKWIHCFEGVQAIFFLAAISEYDQKLMEDETVNRLDEALVLFDSVCNSRWFQDSSIILFLNKTDIFKSKIAKSPIENYFPDYKHGDDWDKAKEFMLEKFLAKNRNPEKQIYPHFTCATDSNSIRYVINAVEHTVIRNALKELGVF